MMRLNDWKYIGGKSDWIDLRSAEHVVTMKQGEFHLIPLGVAMAASQRAMRLTS